MNKEIKHQIDVNKRKGIMESSKENNEYKELYKFQQADDYQIIMKLKIAYK